MSLVTLPSIAEAQFAAYLAANLTGTYSKATPEGTETGRYNVAKGFTADAYELPIVVVKAGKFSELEPWTHVYEGNLSVSVITQIDDAGDPLATHSATLAAVYDLLSNQEAVAAAVNGPNFHLWSYYSISYDQDVSQGENKRALVSILEYKISAQTLAVS